MYSFFTARLCFLSTLFGVTIAKCNSHRYDNNATTPLVTNFPDPNFDPFYQAPSNISSYAPGQVIRSRRVGTTATGNMTKSFQAFYRTTDNQDNAIGSVSTIWIPGQPITPPRMLSLPQAEDALNLDCAPSWAWVNDTSTMEFSYSTNTFTILWALSQGYYVVVSDAEGPNSTWLVGQTEGRATLDGIRATIDFLNLSSSTEIAIASYSGGAHATVWASSLAEQYAPELNIIAAAFGGTPVDIRSTVELLSGGPSALLGMGALVGLASGYPELNRTLSESYTPNGSATVARIRAPNYCLLGQLSHYAGVNFTTALTTSNILDTPGLSCVFARESLLANVSSLPVPVPKFPRFQWHGTADITVPYWPEAAYVQQQCDEGADIRLVTLPGLQHVQALLLGLPGALQFISQAFQGTLTNVTCGANVTIPAIGSAELKELLGPAYASFEATLSAAM